MDDNEIVDEVAVENWEKKETDLVENKLNFFRRSVFCHVSRKYLPTPATRVAIVNVSLVMQVERTMSDLRSSIRGQLQKSGGGVQKSKKCRGKSENAVFILF